MLYYHSATNNINDEMVIYEMNHIWTADMKSSEAMIFAVMNAIFTKNTAKGRFPNSTKDKAQPFKFEA